MKVSFISRIGLPEAKSIERERIEELVRKAGLWEHSSNLAAARLEKAMKVSDLPSEQKAAILDLAVTTESSRVTLSKLRK